MFSVVLSAFFPPNLMDIMKVAVAAKPLGAPLSALANSEGFTDTCETLAKINNQPSFT